MSHDPVNVEVQRFLQALVEKLSPSVMQAVAKKGNGKFEINYASGRFQEAFHRERL